MISALASAALVQVITLFFIMKSLILCMEVYMSGGLAAEFYYE